MLSELWSCVSVDMHLCLCFWDDFRIVVVVELEFNSFSSIPVFDVGLSVWSQMLSEAKCGMMECSSETFCDSLITCTSSTFTWCLSRLFCSKFVSSIIWDTS